MRAALTSGFCSLLIRDTRKLVFVLTTSSSLPLLHTDNTLRYRARAHVNTCSSPARIDVKNRLRVDYKASLLFLPNASEAVLPHATNLQTLDNCINRAMLNLFGVSSNDRIQTIRCFCNLPTVRLVVDKRRWKFFNKLILNNQCISLRFGRDITVLVVCHCRLYVV